MSDSLRLRRSIENRLDKFLPHERVTRLRNLALLMTGLFLAEAVHLAHIVRTWPTTGKIPSLTNRLRRFLSDERLDVEAVYRPVAQLLVGRFISQGDHASAPVRLLLDTARVGLDHRLLTVSIGYRRRALPLAWSVHRGAKGHVSAEEQVALLKRIRPLLNEADEVTLVGDSAFGNVPMMRYARAQGWSFVLRSTGYRYVAESADVAGEGHRIDAIALSPGQSRFIGPVHFTKAHCFGGVSLVLHWAEGEDEPWYLLTSEGATAAVIRAYRVRMWTEELYGDLKGHGFDLEATRLGHATRIERLVLGVCLTYVWLIALGSSVVKRGLRHLVDRKDRRDKSYFRIGWDYLERRICLGRPLDVRFAPYI